MPFIWFKFQTWTLALGPFTRRQWCTPCSHHWWCQWSQTWRRRGCGVGATHHGVMHGASDHGVMIDATMHGVKHANKTRPSLSSSSFFLTLLPPACRPSLVLGAHAAPPRPAFAPRPPARPCPGPALAAPPRPARLSFRPWPAYCSAVP
jgi:hypothetical protein